MPSKELSGSAKVTAFTFMGREKGIAGKGMGNKYEENLLRPYSKISLDGGTRTESGCSFDSPKKTDCAGHVFSDGTIEDLERFDDLHTLVGEILRRTECDGSRTAIPCSATGSRSIDAGVLRIMALVIVTRRVAGLNRSTRTSRVPNPNGLHVREHSERSPLDDSNVAPRCRRSPRTFP